MSSEHEYTIVHMHFLRGCRVNVDLYRDMYWAILIDKVRAEDLFKELYNNRSKFKGGMFKAISTLLYKHASDMSISKDNFDVTLLHSIIRNLLTTLPKPTQGWGIEPLPTNISITDDVERMRFSRNKLYGHITRPSLNETEFKTLMDEAEAIVERVGQHLHLTSSENLFKKKLGNIRNKDISDQWEIQIKELIKIEIENRERIDVNTERIKVNTERIEVNTKRIEVNTERKEESTERKEVNTERIEEIAAGCAVNTYKGLKTSIKDEPLSSDSDDSEDGKKKEEKKRKKIQKGKKEEMDEYALPKPFLRSHSRKARNAVPKTRSETPVANRGAKRGLKTSITDEPLSKKKEVKKRKKIQEGKKEETDEYALPKPFLRSYSRKGPVGRVLHDAIWKRWEQSIDDSNLDGIQSLLKTGDLPDNELFGQLCDKEGLDSNIVKNVCDTIGRAIMKTDSKQILCVWPGYRPNKEEQIVFVICTSVATTYVKPFVVYPLNTFSVIFRGANDFSSEAKDVLYSRESLDKLFTERERKNIRICIQENSKQLMHDHSNLTIISASSVRSEGFGTEISAKKPDTCIVLYLHVKGVVPLSEKPFPKLLKDSRGEVEFPVDVREGGFVNLSGHTASEPHTNLRIGCQIGSDWKKTCKGTLGAFVNLPDGLGLGCITCAHVLLSDDQMNILREKEMVELTDLHNVGDVNYIRVFQPAVLWDETPIGHVCKAIFRVGGIGVTGVDVALVKLTNEQRHPTTGCVPDGYHDHAGFTEENKMHFSSGEASSCEPNDTEYEAGLLKFGCCSGITRGKLHIHGPSVRRQTLSGTHMNFGFELHDQIECLPTKPVFAEPGDSGALVFIAKGGDHHKLKAVGIVEGCTSMDTVLLTPIWEVLDALGLQNNLKVFQHGSIFGRQSNAESTVEATAQCSPPRVCPSSSSHADTFQGDSDGLASVIANVSRTDSELRKEMSELRQDFKKFSENQDMKLQKIMDLLQANHQK